MNFVGAELFRTAYTPEQLPPPGPMPEIVFSGRSNVGKSSLLNRLFGRRSLARVSSAPGKTASVNFYRCGGALFVDLPGYGFARVSSAEREKWGGLVNRYLDGERPIALVAQLLDIRHPPSDDDRLMLDFLHQKQLPFAMLLTKCDKLKPSRMAARLAEWNADRAVPSAVAVLPVSAQTGEGVRALKSVLSTALSAAAGRSAGGEKPGTPG